MLFVGLVVVIAHGFLKVFHQRRFKNMAFPSRTLTVKSANVQYRPLRLPGRTVGLDRGAQLLDGAESADRVARHDVVESIHPCLQLRRAIVSRVSKVWVPASSGSSAYTMMC